MEEFGKVFNSFTYQILFENIFTSLLLGLNDGLLALLHLMSLLCIPHTYFLDATSTFFLLLFAILLCRLRLSAQLFDFSLSFFILSISCIFQFLLSIFGRCKTRETQREVLVGVWGQCKFNRHRHNSQVDGKLKKKSAVHFFSTCFCVHNQ